MSEDGGQEGLCRGTSLQQLEALGAIWIDSLLQALLGCPTPRLPREDGGGQPGAQCLLAAGAVGQKGATVLCQE